MSAGFGEDAARQQTLKTYRTGHRWRANLPNKQTNKQSNKQTLTLILVVSTTAGDCLAMLTSNTSRRLLIYQSDMLMEDDREQMNCPLVAGCSMD